MEPQLPALGIGCWSFGGGAYWGPQDQADVDRVVAAALASGVTYFDTAESYNGGTSEQSLGIALRGKRDRAIIGTKVSPHHCYPGQITRRCEASLGRLQTDRVDIYMLHWPLNPASVRHYTADESLANSPPELNRVMEELAELRRKGLIRSFGVSNFGQAQMTAIMEGGYRVVTNQIPYNLLMRAAEAEVLPLCASARVQTMGYSALMQGLLSRPVTHLAEIPPVRMRTRHFSGLREGSRHTGPGIEEATLASLKAIAAISLEVEIPLPQLALRWAMANPQVNCTLVGCRTLQQLRENLRALDEPLSQGAKSRLDDATSAVKTALGTSIDYFESAANARSR